MPSFKNLFDTTAKKIGSIAALFLIGIVLVVLFRSCSEEAPAHKAGYFIGRDSTWYPLQLYGKDKNLQAFTNELFADIFSHLHLRYLWVEASPNALLSSLNTHEYDAILSTLSPDPVTNEHYLFSNLIFETGPVLVVRANSDINSLAQLKDDEVGIIEGVTPAINDLFSEIGADQKALSLHTYRNINQATDALEEDRVDGVIMGAIPAYLLAEGAYKGSIRVVTAPLNDEGLRLVTLKTKEGELLIDDFDKALEEMKKNGTYDTLIEKWDLINPEVHFEQK